MPILTIETDAKNINVACGANIIDICETEETSILFGCRDGACGACMVRVLKNPENLSPIQDNERDFLDTMMAQDNERLACQCQVLGDVTIAVAD